jgi:hypothetical protein
MRPRICYTPIPATSPNFQDQFMNHLSGCQTSSSPLSFHPSTSLVLECSRRQRRDPTCPCCVLSVASCSKKPPSWRAAGRIPFVAESRLVTPGHQPGSRRAAVGRRHVALREPHAARCQRVDVRRRDLRISLATQFAVAHVVDEDQQDVGAVVPGSTAPDFTVRLVVRRRAGLHAEGHELDTEPRKQAGDEIPRWAAGHGVQLLAGGHVPEAQRAVKPSGSENLTVRRKPTTRTAAVWPANVRTGSIGKGGSAPRTEADAAQAQFSRAISAHHLSEVGQLPVAAKLR